MKKNHYLTYNISTRQNNTSSKNSSHTLTAHVSCNTILEETWHSDSVTKGGSPSCTPTIKWLKIVTIALFTLVVYTFPLLKSQEISHRNYQTPLLAVYVVMNFNVSGTKKYKQREWFDQFSFNWINNAFVLQELLVIKGKKLFDMIVPSGNILPVNSNPINNSWCGLFPPLIKLHHQPCHVSRFKYYKRLKKLKVKKKK